MNIAYAEFQVRRWCELLLHEITCQNVFCSEEMFVNFVRVFFFLLQITISKLSDTRCHLEGCVSNFIKVFFSSSNCTFHITAMKCNSCNCYAIIIFSYVELFRNLLVVMYICMSFFCTTLDCIVEVGLEFLNNCKRSKFINVKTRTQQKLIIEHA